MSWNCSAERSWVRYPGDVVDSLQHSTNSSGISCTAGSWKLMPNTRRRRRRDSTVEWSCVGGVYTRFATIVGDSFELSTSLNKFANSEVELRRVGGMNAPVGSRDPVYNFLCCWAIEVSDKWRHIDAVVEKVINIDQNLRSQTVKPLCSVSNECFECFECVGEFL